ncbi:MAG TPA: dTDP-glucose 4,6-dehydratase [Candidatus Limnocylindrales bacterium]
MNRILVTGAAGFIGSQYVRSMLAGEYAGFEETRITVVDNLTYAGNRGNLPETHPRLEFVKADICNVHMMTSLLRGQDAVIHMAAESHVDRSIEAAADFVHTNVFGTQSVLEAAVRAEVPRVVYVSTDEVYGTIEHGSWTEDWPLMPNSPYAASKAGGDLMARAYFRTHGLNVSTTRCSNNYGPYQHREKLIPRFITRLLKGRTVGLYGDGLNVREWLHVEDHCRGIQLVLTGGKAGEIYNIGGGNHRTNREIAEKLVEMCGATPELIEYISDRKGHDFRYSLDDAKIRDDLGYRQLIPFEEGLASTVEWYKANYLGHAAYY